MDNDVMMSLQVSTPQASSGQLICSILLHISPPSQWLTELVEKIYSNCDRLSSMIAVRLEQAEQLDEADKVYYCLQYWADQFVILLSIC